MDHNPHEVMIVTCEEVLHDLYGDQLAAISLDEAKQAFLKWVIENNAFFCSGGIQDCDVLFKAVLNTIQEGKNILVMSGPNAPPKDDIY